MCDGYADGIARTYADKAYTIPVTDVDAIALMCREEGVDGIITSFSDLLLECMVKIADKAGLPCYLKPEQLSWYRDKSACRDVLDKLGLPAPGFRKISVELLKQGSEEEIQQSIANLQYPLISKPLDKYAMLLDDLIRSAFASKHTGDGLLGQLVVELAIGDQLLNLRKIP